MGRLEAIAINQAKQRLSLQQMDDQYLNSQTKGQTYAQRRQSLAKHMEDLQGYVPPEVKAR